MKLAATPFPVKADPRRGGCPSDETTSVQEGVLQMRRHRSRVGVAGMALSCAVVMTILVQGLQAQTVSPPSLGAVNAFTQGFHSELQGRYEEALSSYSVAVESDAGNAYLLTRMARCYLELGKNDLAGRRSQEAVKIDSSLAEPHWIRGISLAHQGKLEPSLPWLRKAALLRPEEDSYASSLIQVLGALGRVDEAAQELEQLVGGAAESARWMHRFGVLLLRQGRQETALKMFRRVVEKDPQNAKAWELIGDISMQQKRSNDAADAYLQALQIQPSNGRVARNLLPILAELERWNDARLVVSTFRGEVQEEPGATQELARWLLSRGEGEKALAVVGDGLGSHPEDPVLLRMKMRILTSTGRWPEVLEASRRLQTVLTDDVEALRLEAAALADGRRWDEAIETLVAVSLKKSRPWIECGSSIPMTSPPFSFGARSRGAEVDGRSPSRPTRGSWPGIPPMCGPSSGGRWPWSAR
jgi:Flp pilus assembly protein TadD